MTAPIPVEHPHAPKVGRVQRLLGRFHVVGVFWFRFSIFGGRILPAWTVPIVEFMFTVGFFFFLFNIRRAVAANLTAVLGPCGFWERQRRIFQTFWEFAQCFGERQERFIHPERFRWQTDDATLATFPEGVIFVTAHIGAWDMSAQVAPVHLDRLIHVVREEELDQEAQEFVAGLVRKMVDPRCVTHFATDDPRLGMLLTEALRRGEIVALQGDRSRAGSRSVPVTLFGRLFDLPAGPAALARVTGAVMVPVFCFREGRHRYRTVLREPIRVGAGPDRDAEIAEATRRLAAEIEWAIRQHPHQWFCFGRLWP